MPPVPPPRGYVNELLEGVRDGSTESTVALLSIGSFDINSAVYRDGGPLLMGAASRGHSEIAGILLSNGASTSIVDADGFSALHKSAGRGHLAVTRMLIEAGADLEAQTYVGHTPLYIAVLRGHLEMMRALIKAGGNPNNRILTGQTILYSAASQGQVDAVKILLRAEASPLLATVHKGKRIVPLDAAAAEGQSGVVRGLLRQFGIEGCGGESAGLYALELAAQGQDVDIMAMLTEAGVIDKGSALNAAARRGREAPVKFLLQQQQQQQQQEEMWKASGEAAYVNAPDQAGRTPLFDGIFSACYSSSRIVRLLADAGAGTSSVIRIKDINGEVVIHATPLTITTSLISERKILGEDATEKQLHSLEAIRRLLLQVEAVHAVSWLWPSNVPFIAHVVEGRSEIKMTSTLLPLVFPILRRRARRRGVLLAALFRYSGKA